MANTIKLKRGTSTPSTSDIASGEVAIDTSAKKLYINDSGTVKEIGGGGSVGGASGIDLNDSVKVRFGTGNDAELYFDGVNTYLKNTPASSFYIQSGGNLLLENTNGENYVKGVANGEVLLYHNGTEKFATTSYGNASAGQVRVTSSNATTPAFSVGDSGTGFYNTGTNAIGYSANGTQKWNINSSGDLRLVDSVKANFGTGDDLSIYHNSTNSYLENSTGNLIIDNSSGVDMYINSGNDIYIRPQGSENGIKVIGDAAVELYYANSKKFETTGDSGGGIKVFNDIIMPDSGVIRLGAASGGDLKIYHDGSNSYIDDAGTGNLYLRGSASIELRKAGGTEKMLYAEPDAAVELYYDNARKLRTTSTGIAVEDHLDMDDDHKIRLGSGGDCEVFHDGTNTMIDNNTGDLKISSSGTLRLRGGAVALYNEAQTETMLYAAANSSVQLMYDNAEKIRTTSSGLRINDSIYLYFGTGEDMLIGHDASHSYITNTTGELIITDTSLIRVRTDDFRIYKGNGTELMFRAEADGACGLRYDNSVKLETTSSGVTVTGVCNVTSYLNMTTADNQKIYLGQSNDLQIFHDGSNNYLRGYTAGQALYIDSLQDIRLRAGDNAGSYQNSIYMDNNGGVHCYYDNSKKMQTYSGGCIFQGNIKADQDDATLVLGASSDIQMWHGSGDSTLKNFTGDFQILCTGDDINIKAADDIRLKPQGDEAGVYVYGNAGVEIYYDNSKKLHSHSGGVTISGSVHMNDGNKYYCGNSDDLEIWNSGSHSYIKTGTSGHYLYIQNTNGSINIEAKINESSIWCGADGKVELYFDNSKKIETTSSGVNLTSGHLYPNSDNTHDLGTAGNRWRNVYTNDLHLSNQGHSNDVDGTWGSFTIQEGAEDLFLMNKRNGKRYKFNLTEVA